MAEFVAYHALEAHARVAGLRCPMGHHITASAGAVPPQRRLNAGFLIIQRKSFRPRQRPLAMAIFLNNIAQAPFQRVVGVWLYRLLHPHSATRRPPSARSIRVLASPRPNQRDAGAGGN